MNCETCKDRMPDAVPYIVHQAAEARAERHIRRLIVALAISVVLLFASNAIWLWYESQYETISYQQDGEGVNNINTGKQGDVYGPASEGSQETSR